MTLIDLFREFSRVATVEGYPKSARILYYTMLWYWNEQRRPDVTTLPHVQLYTLAGLPEATYRDAFKYLAEEGWVKRVKSRNRAVSTWIMRDRRVKTAPPAGFPMDARGQRQSTENQGEKPQTAVFPPDSKEAEKHDAGSIVLGRPETDDSGPSESDRILSILFAVQGTGD